MADPLVIRCGATADKAATLTDAAGDAWDASAYTGGISSQIRDKDGNLIATFTVTETDLSAGSIRLGLTPAATDAIDPGFYFFDVLLEATGQPTYRTNAGTVQFTRRITALSS